jgi:CubicO group peptidase (beta-lactamase class C family)
MRGFPPAEQDRWRLEDWQFGPTNRWSFQHLREIVPTARVARSDEPFALSDGEPIDPTTTVAAPNGREMSVEEILEGTYNDGFLVIVDGRVRVERYANDMTPTTPHMLFSVSKSIVGSVCGILADRGDVDVDAPLTRYVPEFERAGYDGARVRDVLDMRSGIAFSEDYLDPMAEVRQLEQVIGWAPRTIADLPTSMYEWLTTLKAKAEHGGAFEYRSCENDVLGWVCERASGVRMPELISELLWQPLGAEHDMDAGIDPAGAICHDGGLAGSLRDLGRFGRMLADRGVVDGRQVVPEWWLDDARRGGPDSREAYTQLRIEPGLEDGIYRSQFWVPEPGGEVLLCLGIHGQMVYADQARRFVGVALSSWPTPEDDRMFRDQLALMRGLAAQH